MVGRKHVVMKGEDPGSRTRMDAKAQSCPNQTLPGLESKDSVLGKVDRAESAISEWKRANGKKEKGKLREGES